MFATRSIPDRAVGMAWMPQTLPDLWAVRCWLHHPRRAKAFWLPIADARITAGNISARSTLHDRHPLTRPEMAWPELAICSCARVRGRVHVPVYFGLPRQDRTTVLTLSAAAGASIAASAVDVLCPLHCVRLENQDRVEFAHLYRGRDRRSPIQLRAIEVPVP